MGDFEKKKRKEGKKQRKKDSWDRVGVLGEGDSRPKKITYKSVGDFEKKRREKKRKERKKQRKKESWDKVGVLGECDSRPKKNILRGPALVAVFIRFLNS